MIDRKTIYETARRVVKQTQIEAKIYNVKRQREIESGAPNVKRQREIESGAPNVRRTPDEVIVYFYAEKRIPMKELARNLEFTLNVPIKLKRVTKEEFGRVGETQILTYHQCCAPITKKCLFDRSHGCPYGIPIQEDASTQALAATKPAKKPAPQQKKAQKRPTKRKLVRRIVVK